MAEGAGLAKASLNAFNKCGPMIPLSMARSTAGTIRRPLMLSARAELAWFSATMPFLTAPKAITDLRNAGAAGSRVRAFARGGRG
ncbi:hypothetical protein [Rhodopila sp.]|uniref:hypothetical protein n=1 Tax=Rhodopila sp. TaxID=2480087 RepID=UPI003D0F09C2